MSTEQEQTWLMAMATLCRKLGVKRYQSFNGTEIEMGDTPPWAPATEPATELPEPGQGMPSDEAMLLYATPFFETEEEKKEAAAKDDAAEDDK